MNYTISADNLHIEDSYMVKKNAMEVVLRTIKSQYPSSMVWWRRIDSLRAEWIVHNWLYSLGLWRERTKAVDLNVPCDKPEWVYKTVAALVGWMVR